jgi:putative Holliday junction resolvase
MNFLGIDYGTKRIGLSYSDSEIGFAFPIDPISVSNGNFEQICEEITEIITLRRIHKIIIGYPINMDDSIGEKAREVDYFIAKLQQYTTIEIERFDERLTSESVQDLQKSRSASNRKKLRNKGSIDSAAATIILQDYLSEQNL